MTTNQESSTQGNEPVFRDANDNPISLAQLRARVKGSGEPHQLGRFELWIGQVRVWCNTASDAAQVAWYFNKMMKEKPDPGPAGKPIDLSELDTRTRGLLIRIGIETAADIAKTSKTMLLGEQGFGIVTISRIESWLMKKYRLTMRP